jgi:PAS domain-containing protein
MENKLFELEVTREFLLVTAPKNEGEAKESPVWRTDVINGHASFNLDWRGRVIYRSPSAARLTGHPPEEITGQHISYLYEDRDADIHKMPQSSLGIAVKQRFYEYQGWWLRRAAPHILARVMIMPFGSMEDDFVVMVWDMSKNRRELEVMGERRHKTSLLDG